MSILIIAEHDSKSLKKATLNVVNAAKKLSNDIHILIAGQDCEAVCNAASQVEHVSKVLCADNAAYAHQISENVAPLIAKIAKNYSHILAPSTTSGKNILPRLAALLDIQMISDISKIISADTFVRPIYAGNALATIKSSEALNIITVRMTAFDPVKNSGNTAPIEALETAENTDLTHFVKQEITVSERPELTSARIVVSGGRGLGSQTDFEKLILPLADKLGAAVGASRVAIDSGWVPNDYQVGQTGKQVAPEFYIAIGISGAIQHMAGMKDSKIIVAINKDEDAPIFEIADFGIVGDLHEILPEMMAALNTN